MRREADQRVGAQQPACLGRRQVVLADVDPVGPCLGDQVRTVVEHEGHPRGGADGPDESRTRHEVGVTELLVAQLDDVDAALDAATHECLEVRPIRGAEVEATVGQVPAVAGRRAAHPAFGSLARASAFICCLNWRTFARASGESMSATER